MKYLLATVMFAALLATLVLVVLCTVRFYAQHGPALVLLIPSMVLCALIGFAAGAALDELETLEDL